MARYPFSTLEDFRQDFLEGLLSLLHRPSLGEYILVHANASFDASIYEHLQEPLRHCFYELAEQCRSALIFGRDLPGEPDDQSVFLKLMAIGFDYIHMTEFREEGPWELQFNHIRAFRPARMASELPTGIYQPFDPKAFHFNKAFLRKEVFWAGRLRGLDVELLYNKFPFSPLHGLLVPERKSREPQFLSHPYHLYIWSLAEELAEKLPGLGFAYNSFGAYASVNHLHFQLFVHTDGLPIEAQNWTHNGGNDDYPALCEVYTSALEAWERLDELHAAEISYNLLYLPGRLYCLPRRTQGSYTHASWTRGFAWYEMVGGITTNNREDFLSLTDKSVREELAKVGPQKI